MVDLSLEKEKPKLCYSVNLVEDLDVSLLDHTDWLYVSKPQSEVVLFKTFKKLLK